MKDTSVDDAVNTIDVLVPLDADGEEAGTKGLFRATDREFVLQKLPVATLQRSVREVCAAVRGIFDEVARESGEMDLAEAQLSFEVNSKGGLNLIGSAEIGTKGAVVLVFRKP
jgi:hypothetical protein